MAPWQLSAISNGNKELPSVRCDPTVSCQQSAASDGIKELPSVPRDLAERYITPKADLLKRLGQGRAMAAFLKADASLDAKWWGGSYMASPTVMQNIPKAFDRNYFANLRGCNS